ncbi:MAG: hypothetical protein AB8I58_23190 [Anaerolineales bacterium]|jgi:hypothetical protein
MKKNFKSLIWAGLSLLLATLACRFLGSNPAPTPLPPTETAVTSPTTIVAASPATNPEAQTNENECTTLQDVNLRTGPGTAFRNPIGVVLKDSVVVPVGFDAEGIPGGSWILIEASNGNPSGWITAGADFVTCNMDFNSLPAVEAAAPPPPPLPSSVRSSNPEGGCGPDEEYQCDVIVTDESFLQFQIFKYGKELTQDDNLKQVSFSVRQGKQDDNGPEVYSIVEGASAYCIFGGNGPCNMWPEEDYVPVWEPGSPVNPGTYFVEILATVEENGDENNIRWAADFDITLP